MSFKTKLVTTGVPRSSKQQYKTSPNVVQSELIFCKTKLAKLSAMTTNIDPIAKASTTDEKASATAPAAVVEIDSDTLIVAEKEAEEKRARLIKQARQLEDQLRVEERRYRMAQDEQSRLSHECAQVEELIEQRQQQQMTSNTSRPNSPFQPSTPDSEQDDTDQLRQNIREAKLAHERLEASVKKAEKRRMAIMEDLRAAQSALMASEQQLPERLAALKTFKDELRRLVQERDRIQGEHKLSTTGPKAQEDEQTLEAALAELDQLQDKVKREQAKLWHVEAALKKEQETKVAADAACSAAKVACEQHRTEIAELDVLLQNRQRLSLEQLRESVAALQISIDREIEEKQANGKSARMFENRAKEMALKFGLAELDSQLASRIVVRQQTKFAQLREKVERLEEGCLREKTESRRARRELDEMLEEKDELERKMAQLKRQTVANDAIDTID